MKNVTYIISDIDKAIAFEWVAEALNKSKFNLSFILLNTRGSFLEDYLIKLNFKVYRINYNSKKDIPLSILKISYFLLKNKIDIVHTHLFNANIVGLTAAWLCRVKKRIYTRHHSTYHHTYFLKAVKWDRFCNFLATDIIAISKNVKHVLIDLENVPRQKITKIYHGFKLNEFLEKNNVAVNTLTQKYNPENKFPVIGVISRFIELKGVQYIIPAFKSVLQQYPNALLLLFNTSGDYEKEIDLQLSTLPNNSFKKTTFENEITSIYHLFDLFIHVPINNHCEAFGQTYIESMASCVPLIATKSGIGNEILVDGYNSLVVPYQDTNAIYEAIIRLLIDENLRNNLVKNSLSSVKEIFSINKMVEELETLYLR